jgi:hypothetical protein
VKESCWCRRAVIDDEARLAGLARDLAFLHQEAPVGRAGSSSRSSVRRLIRLGHEVGRLAADLEMFDFAKVTAQARAGLAGGTFHHADQSGNAAIADQPALPT